MFKTNNAKKLYRFSKKHQHKPSTSTIDLNDSLDLIPTEQFVAKAHQRTQSCPSVAPTDQPESQTLPQQTTTRSHKFKPTHRNCHSQVDIDGLSSHQNSISIDNLSSILRKNSKEESILKKSRVGGQPNFKPLVDREHYQKMKIDQQIKKYELNQELAQLEKNSKGINLKHQILESLMNKFDHDGLTISQTYSCV